MKAKYLLVVAGCAVLFPAFCHAEQIKADEIVPRSKMIYIEPADEKTFFDRGKISNIAGVTLGYDNNAYLDTRRDGDGFTQLYYRGSFVSPITRDKKVDAILEYELMSLLYMGEHQLDIIKNGLHAAIDNKVNDKFELLAGYRFDAYSYVNNPDENFYENTLEGQVNHTLPFKMVESLRYALGFKNYMDKHTRTSATFDSDKKRFDLRNTVEYSLGKYFAKDFAKLSFEYFNNNSNEKYINYYDYDSFKPGVSLTHLFNDKVFGYASFARQYRTYRSRSITLDNRFKERDRTYLITAALYYNINKALSTGVSYTYRQNWSNEPIENYSGSLIALTTYYRF